MNRPTWSCHVRIELLAGTVGVVELTAHDLLVLREVQEILDKAARMAGALVAEPRQQPATLKAVS